MKNQKPNKQVWELYDYNDCKTYIEKKHGIETRDYAGTFRGNEDAPYQDFWHFVLDKAPVSNGCIVTMCEWWLEGAEDWQREIGLMFLDEFGEGEKGNRAIQFYVWW